MEFDPNKRPVYIFRHPFRFVKPYEHEYRTYAKKRWLGKKIIDVLSKQFQAYSEQYFKQAVLAGKITINQKKVDLDYIIKNSDLLIHSTIREQPPILDLPIEIIHQDEDFLVICKPPSVVVHTGGGYHYNTVLAILHYEMGYENLYILHRIDRLTSGVVILAKKKQKATKFHQQSIEEVMKKFYFARVSGNVGFEQKILEVPMVCLSHKEGVWSVYQPQTMKQLIKNQEPKESSTKFIKVWYDQQTDSSLLQCYPITGRTHQIRVHLKYLGHPILNDTVYGGRFVGNCIIQKINLLKQKVENDKQIKDIVSKKVKSGKNQEKQQQNPKDYQIEYQKWDYKSKSLEICLHSFKYRFEEKEYISRKPYWTQKQSIQTLKQQGMLKIEKSNNVKSRYQRNFIEQQSKKEKIANIETEKVREQKQQANQK